MNYLILSNYATNYYRFYSELSNELQKRGHKVIYVVDCNVSKKYNNLETNENVYCFTDFMKDNKEFSKNEEDIFKKYYRERRLWDFYPDYERSNYYKIIDNKTTNNKSVLIAKGMFILLYRVIRDNNINGIFYENASNLMALIAEYLAKDCFSIMYYGIEISRFPHRVLITNNYRNNDKYVLDRYQEISTNKTAITKEDKGFIKKYIEDFDKIEPSYMKDNNFHDGFLKRYFRLTKIKRALFLIKNLNSKEKFNYTVGNPLLTSYYSVHRYFMRSLKSILIKKMIFKNQENINERFILYPLHYHPEATTSVLARYYGDEYEVIRNISFSLPHDIKLYVKEHPSANALHPLAFYKNITKLPNVKLVPDYIKSKRLIRESLGVITLTSTVGYEALLLKKRVVTFGSVFYGFHRNLRKVEKMEDLPDLLDWLVEPFVQNDLEDYNFMFCLAYYKSTIFMPHNYNNFDKKIQHDNSVLLLDHLKII